LDKNLSKTNNIIIKKIVIKKKLKYLNYQIKENMEILFLFKEKEKHKESNNLEVTSNFNFLKYRNSRNQSEILFNLTLKNKIQIE